jgi:hypothetical protein
VKDAQDDQIEGSFYAQEMIKAQVAPEALYKIENIIKKRTVYTKHRNSKEKIIRVGKKQLFVKWQGYPNKFNSWIDKKDAEEV